jgi:TonB family protein
MLKRSHFNVKSCGSRYAVNSRIVKLTATVLIAALWVLCSPSHGAGQKTRVSRSGARQTKPVKSEPAALAIIADTSVAQLPPKYVGDSAGAVYQQLNAVSFRLRKSQFETTSEYQSRITLLLNGIKITPAKTVNDRFSFVHPYGDESYDADTQIFTVKPDTNYEIGLGYDVPELPNDIRSGRDYSSIDLTRTSRNVGSRIGRTAIGIRKRITVRAYSALRLVMPNSSMKHWSDGLRFRVSSLGARQASGKVWLAVTGRLAPPYVLHDADVDNATLSDPEEAHSFHFYLFFVPDSIVLYNIATGQIYGAWDLTQSGSDFDRPAQGPMRRRSDNPISDPGLVRKPRILSKPEPVYTEEARKNQITGTVVLSALFSETGEVTDIQVIKGLSHGLNERAIDAAKRITFVPAESNGKKVSFRMTLEYNFNLY